MLYILNITYITNEATPFYRVIFQALTKIYHAQLVVRLAVTQFSCLFTFACAFDSVLQVVSESTLWHMLGLVLSPFCTSRWCKMRKILEDIVWNDSRSMIRIWVSSFLIQKSFSAVCFLSRECTKQPPY